MIKVLFVCMGNICRSPTAEGVFRQLVRDQGLDAAVEIDSAGTHGYHVGKPADRRAQQAALARGVDLSDIRSRQISASDFEYFDWVIAMDSDNLAILETECPERYRHKLHLFMQFAEERPESEVPDPYFGGDQGFNYVFDLVADAARGLLRQIRRSHGLDR